MYSVVLMIWLSHFILLCLNVMILMIDKYINTFQVIYILYTHLYLYIQVFKPDVYLIYIYIYLKYLLIF